MILITRTDSQNKDFINLVRHLDAELAKQDGSDHHFYDQFNKIDDLKFIVVAYENEFPVGCGAMKEFESNTMEIKRMYVPPGFRRTGVAAKILSELEKWAAEMSFNKYV